MPDCLVQNGFVGIKRCRHGLFAFNRNDRFIGRSLDLYGEWCESELELLLGILRPGDTVIDVGANIGTHAVPFAQAVGAAGCVLGFEPQRVAFQLLCANAVLNGLTNMDCRQQAVAAVAGAVRVPVIDPGQSFNFGAVSVAAGTDGERVPAVTIDGLGLAACRLIKIDVEGMEPEVLRGARDTIAANRPVLFVENNTIDKATPTLEAIDQLGYTAWWHLALYYNPANFFGNAENVFATLQPEANLYCLPAGQAPGRDDLVACTGVGDNWKQALHRGIAEGNPRFFPDGRR